jgi:RND family efflux transporter MFP subunit
LTVCKSGNNDKSILENKIPVKVISIKKEFLSFPVRTSGSLASKTEMKLSFKTGGIINRIAVDEGQTVQKGQLLAQLNLSEIESAVNQARLGLEKAERDLKRAENLYADSVATLEQLQNARTAVDYARSQLRIAEFNRQYSQIVAPAKGKILKKLAEEHEMIAPGYPLFLFSSIESDWVLRVSLTDVDVVKIQVYDSAVIHFDAFPNSSFNATVSEIAKVSDPYTGTYEVELRLVSKDKNFFSGLIGKAEIIPSQKKEYEVLPYSALHDADDMGGYIYLAHDSLFEKKHIDILSLSDSMIYFKCDVYGTEKVIVDGGEYLNPGSVIEIVN